MSNEKPKKVRKKFKDWAITKGLLNVAESSLVIGPVAKAIKEKLYDHSKPNRFVFSRGKYVRIVIEIVFVALIGWVMAKQDDGVVDDQEKREIMDDVKDKTLELIFNPDSID